MSESDGAWASIKKEYWSVRGVAVTVLHTVTIAAGLLIYIGWHQVWHGTPAFAAIDTMPPGNPPAKKP